MTTKQQPDAPEQTLVVNANYELFIFLVASLAFVNSALLVLAADTPEQQIILWVTGALWLILALDFLARAARYRFRFHTDIANWLVFLGSLPIPFVSLARLIGLGLWGRRLRRQDYRWMGQAIVARRAQSTLLLIIFTTIVVFETGGILVLHAEAGDPAANIRTAGDALWWGYVTVATVGYGDHYPVTPFGRIVGILMITFGVALFTTLTGFLADWFRHPRRMPGDAPVPQTPAPTDAPADAPEALALIRHSLAAQERARQADMAELSARLDAIEAQLRERGQLPAKPTGEPAPPE
jgi:voltage-gated potassium channel